MSSNEGISLVVEKVEDILDSLFTSGFGVAQKDMTDRIKEASEDCEKYGMDFASRTLKEMADGLERRRHNMDFDYSGLTGSFCRLDYYLGVVRKRLTMEGVKEGLKPDEKGAIGVIGNLLTRIKPS
ncbi:MAG: hypothetical protein ACOYWZ_10550 [Bacillota bacterium]